MKNTIRVHSTSLCHAPGIFKWAIHSHNVAWKVDFIHAIFQGGITKDEARAIVSDPSIVSVNHDGEYIEYIRE